MRMSALKSTPIMSMMQRTSLSGQNVVSSPAATPRSGASTTRRHMHRRLVTTRFGYFLSWPPSSRTSSYKKTQCPPISLHSRTPRSSRPNIGINFFRTTKRSRAPGQDKCCMAACYHSTFRALDVVCGVIFDFLLRKINY